ncbi:MAG: TonB-dependent receptor [Sphingomonadales bacterium]|nr:TonB-dependent receptor [Sphingomonadales bacterium]
MSATIRNWTALGAAVALMPQIVSAAETQQFSVPAGRLDQAILQLGRQGGVSIALADPSLGSTRVRGVSGRMDAAAALRRLLTGTELTVIAIDARSYRIVRRAPARPKPAPTPPRAAASPRSVEPAAPPVEIVVTASKRDTRLDDYPGSVTVMTLDERLGATPGQHGSSMLIGQLPVLNSTNLGPGRNKLFIRGVADSSFTGPTQATVGQYFGYARLNYNAPDPDLELYDIEKVEVLEGPQGTLYGAGSLGGIVRLSPHVPDSNDWSGSLRGGIAFTDHGASSRDGAAMLNIPIAADIAGLRIVAYQSVDGGYIEDVRRNLSNINRSKISGGRAALRVTPGDGWTIDAGWVRQDIQSRDGQYVEDGLPDLSQASAIAQPFDNDYSLFYATVEKSWGGLILRSTGSIIHHDLSSRFDASVLGPGTPIAFDQSIAIRQHANETTLSREEANGHGWVVGISYNDGSDRVARRLGDPDDPAPLSDVVDERAEWAAFGEWSFGIAPTISASLGGRYSRTRFAGEIIDPAHPSPPEPRRTLDHFVPLAAISWKPQSNWLVYARYQEGFRPGGLAVSGINAVTRFDSDTISTFEVGTRFGQAGLDPFSVSLAASHARWELIQADLVDAQGFPYADNIGNGGIWSLSGTASWRPAPALQIDASAFFNRSRLTQPAAGYERAEDNDLPNIAQWGARLGIGWSSTIGPRERIIVRGNARYFGPSYLGVGNLLDIEQGQYIDTAVDIRIERDAIGLSIGLTNLFNADQNRFSYGNPFTVMRGLQETPLRPRTIRIGLDAIF